MVAIGTDPEGLPGNAYVAAAKNRKKIPFWAMSGLALLPIWALLYLVALTPSTKVEAGPLSIGTQVFSNCAEIGRAHV